MRSIRRRIRHAVCVAMPTVAIACAGTGPEGPSNASGTSSTGAGQSAVTSASTITSGSSSGTSSGSGSPASTTGGSSPGSTVSTSTGGFTGRRPEGLCVPRFASGSPLGDRYAQLAHLEAASIAAFERLAQELSDAGAPRRLVAAARSAARDEARHARMMSRLAAQSGGKPETPVTGPTDSRSLTAMAEENAVEGCVRETVGAALALAQARAAPSRQLRRLWETIARDEAEHAQLAWDVNAWLQPKLSNAARRRIARSQRVALAAMRKECGVEDPLGAELGAPSAEGKRALFAALERELPWPKA